MEDYLGTLCNSAEAELLKADLMKKADPDKMSSAVSQQVALLGSRSMYERINNNFKELEFEPLLAKVNHSYCGLLY